MFSTRLENLVLFSSNLKLSSANYFNLDQSKILSSGNATVFREGIAVHEHRLTKCFDVKGTLY